MTKAPSYDLVPVAIEQVRNLFERYHVYQSTGTMAVYAFAVVEDGWPVAAWLWQPPPPGSAGNVCPACPHGVLALSRMVAVPREERRLRHVSKPLKRQMRSLIDRTRWPVLVTYSDESVGHTGYVYKVSGWKPTERSLVDTFTIHGRRISRYQNGKTVIPEGAERGKAWIQRWEHWATPDPASLVDAHWERVAIAGRHYRSGAQAYTYENKALRERQLGLFG